MPSSNEQFWTYQKYAVIGHSAKKNFPKLTYKGLKGAGKEVYPIDPSANAVEGDKTYQDLASLPTVVDAAVIEVPKEETAQWVERAAKAGIGRVWLHMGTDTPDAVAIARDKGIEIHTGTCAVMYFQGGFSAHGLHKVIWKALGKY